MLKKLYLIFITVIIVLANIVFVAGNSNVKLVVNDKVISPPIPPAIINDRTLVPTRAVFEELGADILWVPQSKEAFISLEDTTIILTLNSNKANINGEIKTMDVPPQIVNDYTMLPLRFVATELDFDVNWDDINRIASINTKIIEEEIESNKDTLQIPSVGSSVEESTTEEETESSTEEETESSVEESTNEEETESSTKESTNEEETESSTKESTTEKETESNIKQEIEGFDSEGIITIVKDKNSDNIVYSPIQNENFDVVNLTNIYLPQNGDELFQIKASGKISSITYNIIQDPLRLYIDIENSISKLSNNISVTESSIVKSIRTAQQPDVNNVTRVVFDLTSNQHYDIFLSEDKQTLNVKFKSENKITFQSTNDQDILNLYNFSSSVNYIKENNKVIVDIFNADYNIKEKYIDVDSKFVSSMEVSQLDNSTIRIIFNLTEKTNYDVIGKKIIFSIPTYQNLYYENVNDNPRLILKKIDNVDINLIKHEDNYLDNNYKIILPNNYSNVYGYGNYIIDDYYLKSINITTNGNTEFTFYEQNIYTCVVTEDDENIYINIYHPKSVYKQIVVLDPGHGGTAPGAIKNGVIEKVITLDVGNRVYALLEADPDIKVYATRTTDTNPSFDYRVNMPNHLADMFVSIHCNSIASSSISGVQVFYPNPADERGSISKQLSDVFMDKFTQATGLPNRPANQSLGYSFLVLKNTTIPACLVEMGFLTNISDAMFLLSEQGREKSANGIYEGIKKGFETVIITNR